MATNKIPSIELQMSSTPITAKPRKLKTVWNPEPGSFIRIKTVGGLDLGHYETKDEASFDTPQRFAARQNRKIRPIINSVMIIDPYDFTPRQLITCEEEKMLREDCSFIVKKWQHVELGEIIFFQEELKQYKGIIIISNLYKP